MELDGIHGKQLLKVYESFFESPKTMKECDLDVGVMRENICRYCAVLRKQRKLYSIKKRTCKVTRHLATVFSTNVKHLPPQTQIELFNDYG